MPKENIDFVLASELDDPCFLIAFRLGATGPSTVFSEDSNPKLIKLLSNTTIVTIKEFCDKQQREYQSELKHVGKKPEKNISDDATDVGFYDYFNENNKNPYKKDTIDYHDWIRGHQSAGFAEAENDEANKLNIMQRENES